MKILIAPDKFKGSLSALQVCDAISKGIESQLKGVQITQQPMADGGEGSSLILTDKLGLRSKTVTIFDPLRRQIEATYFHNASQAIIEMSSATGLALLSKSEQNPLVTSTFGTGQLILDAIDSGKREIHLFIGGSATNDAGIGMAHALGYNFLDANGDLVTPIGANLIKIKNIDVSNVDHRISNLIFKVICDVQNPFFGVEGAAFVYAFQKGANREEVKMLDAGLQNIARVIQNDLKIDVSNIKGSGAAGGLGGGAVAFLGASIESGIEYMIQMTDLEKCVSEYDLVITGEGKIDRQTIYGKVVSGVAALALKYKKPCIAVCGISELSDEKMRVMGLRSVLSIAQPGVSINESMLNGGQLLEKRIARFIKSPEWSDYIT